MRGVAGLLAFALLGGCSRDEEQPKQQLDLNPPFAKFAQEAGARAPLKVARDEPWPSSGDAGNLQSHEIHYTATRTVVREAGAPAPAPKNPDEPILAQARVAAGGCFTSLAATAGAPERTAHIVFSVIPTGTVSSADVSSGDTNEPSVLDCLHQVALQTRFSDNGDGPLRTYAIDVRVIAKGSSGGR